MLYILSAPIHTGKTTALQHFCKQYRAVGVLMPDANNCRQIINLATQQQEPIQLVVSEHATDIIIGNYIFDASVFAIANLWLLEIKNAESDFIIIDEIGKLELNNSGLEPAFSDLIKKIDTDASNIIITVRDYLLQQVINKYNLQDATVVNIQQFNTHFGL
jgi:nucleoside-triphosphatase